MKPTDSPQPYPQIQMKFAHAGLVLEVGCGNGWVLGTASIPEPALRFGVDICLPPTIHPKVRLTLADCLQLPFTDNSFDAVIGHVSMPYIPTLDGLTEIVRVLKPGASVWVTFHSFVYLRDRLRSSFQRGDLRDCLFMFYVAVNGILSHLGLPQFRCWWNRRYFETVSTPQGVAKAAARAGLTFVSCELAADRIFFVMTARKPSPSRVFQSTPGWVFNSWLQEAHDVKQTRDYRKESD